MFREIVFVAQRIVISKIQSLMQLIRSNKWGFDMGSLSIFSSVHIKCACAYCMLKLGHIHFENFNLLISLHKSTYHVE